ncbi:MAG: hypothetical protein H6806_02720 [Planctomycetes bacterium]|nr:hypothetical protein [Planctomycetota bacterium]MCB9828667.1 hypothetical protein [Planctomycetota bacterium]MCB9901031.1 hypothetical protein [Planctomycetota bacterium]
MAAPDPVDDLLDRMERALSAATGQPANKTALASALGRKLVQLSHVRSPVHLYRRSQHQLDDLGGRVQALLDTWSAPSGNNKAWPRSHGRLDSVTAKKILGPYVEVNLGGLSLVRSSLESVAQSRWIGDPVRLDVIERFLDEDVCHTEAAWAPAVEALRKAEAWSTGKHADPYVARVGHMIVRAAHRINANSPRGPKSGPSPHQVLMALARRVARRAARTTRDAHTIGSGYRVLGYAHHAAGDFRAALREFKTGIDVLRRTGNQASAEVPRLMLADVDARIASMSGRGANQVLTRLNEVVSSEVLLDADNEVRIAHSTAKLDLLLGRFRSAESHTVKAERLRPLGGLSKHGQIEHWFLMSAAQVGLNSREARESLDQAQRLAEEAHLAAQLNKIAVLRRNFGHRESVAKIAVQGRLPYRHRK